MVLASEEDAVGPVEDCESADTPASSKYSANVLPGSPGLVFVSFRADFAISSTVCS